MSKAEAALWHTYLLEQGSTILAVAYDFACGKYGNVPSDCVGPERYMWRRLTSKRIDAVALRQGAWEIIEVKPYPDIKAPGQAAAYKPLFLDKVKTTLPVSTTLLCHVAHPDIRRIASEFGVDIVVR